MKNICYALPGKAKKVVQELIDLISDKRSFYTQLADCCSDGGYFKAADFFYEKSKSQRYFRQNWADYLMNRGEEAETNAISKPEIKFSDLKSGIESAYKMEIAHIEKMDEFTGILRDVDTLTYKKMLECIDSYILNEYEKMWKVFSGIESAEDQREAEASYWGGEEKISSPE